MSVAKQPLKRCRRSRHWPKDSVRSFFFPSQLDIHVPSAGTYNAYDRNVRKRVLFSKTKLHLDSSQLHRQIFDITTWMRG